MKKLILASLLFGASLFASETVATGAASYKKCAGCHGQAGEKKALGKSLIVSKMSNKDIVSALEGYKSGTYGGQMKGIMIGQVKNLTSDDIKLIADFIVKPEESNTTINLGTIEVGAKKIDTEFNVTDNLDEICIVKPEANAEAGKASYKKCAGCHGPNGEKKGLGKSLIIKDMSKEKIIEALIGYQKGTYGAGMKALMTSQVKTLTEQDIKNIAEYIKQ
ncbi:MAG: c-type cytochrome [Patescibacteria group bacterium]|nr:c-type cytochrome [Patescibacteria group bacterium]